MTQGLRTLSLVMLYLLFNQSTLAQALSAEELLGRVSKKYTSMPAIQLRFSYELKQAGLDFSDQIHGEALLQRQMYRIDLGDQRILCDGQSTWTYIPELQEVTITSA